MSNSAGGGGSGSFKVTPGALNQLANQIANEVKHASEVASKS